MTNAKRDQNREPGLLAVSSADGTTLLPVKINPSTGRVLVEGTQESLPVTDSTAIVKGSSDDTKKMRFEVDGLTTATTRVLTVPDADLTLVGTTTTQTLTNKTLDNTTTLTLKDNLFTLQDGGDVTKQIQFQLSGITTGTTRVITIPDMDFTLGSNTTPLELITTDAGATGFSLEFYHNSATPAANDVVGVTRFYGEDSAGNKTEYAKLESVIVDPTNGSEGGGWKLWVYDSSENDLTEYIIANGENGTLDFLQSTLVLDWFNGNISLNGSTTINNSLTLENLDIVGNTTITSGGSGSFYSIDTSSARTVTFNSSAIAIAGRFWVIKDITGSAGTNNIVISTQGSEKIDGADTYTINTNYGVVRLYSDGSNLFIF